MTARRSAMPYATCRGSAPMILAIDQGTTGTTCLVFDARGADRRPRLLGVRAALPAARLGRARRRRDLGGDAAGRRRGDRRRRHRGRRARRDRDRQPARDRRRLGPGERRAAAPGAGLAGPAHRRALRGAARRRPRGSWSASAPGSSSTPTSPATKIEWLLRNVEGPERAVFGTIDSWLVFKLTGRHATDYTNASRTMLFDIRRRAWDEELCALLGVDPARLPEPLPSACVYGTTAEFGGEVPVAGIAGDQQAALFGQACFEPGTRQEHLRDRQLRPAQHRRRGARPRRGPAHHASPARPTSGPTYALEASIFVTGAAVQWLRDGLGHRSRRRPRRRRWPPRSRATTASTSSRR